MGRNIGFIKKANLLFNSKLDKAISIVITKNLVVNDSEKLLIVYDSKKEKLARRFKRISSGMKILAGRRSN